MTRKLKEVIKNTKFAKPFDFSLEKTGAMIHYLVTNLEKPVSWDQLFEIMYLIDLKAYKELGKPITGVTYIKMPDGWCTLYAMMTGNLVFPLRS